ncbi:MAG TPA: ABC transporter ATP-binding protein [Porphyromonadaceae bacterium]|jgi:ATP-binding cassette subfamily B protein|nr:ABC transporter ATP-binding protein [Porphyromonadaceae bacterium]HBX20649.1 ABC transporter ATP-binding protein [Porphyromonadaceae bacterium]
MAKFPFQRQYDTMQCGITCLQMICNYLGNPYSLNELEQYCPATVEGVSLLGINETASNLGLHTTCGHVSIEQLYNAPLPCILHWEQNHFVVLYKIKGKNRFYIADPGKGLLIYSKKNFKEHWISGQANGVESGIAMFLQATPAFYENKKERISQKKSFKFLFGYIKQYRRYFGQIILGLLIGSLLQLIFPFLTQAIVDIGITHKNIDFIYLILFAQLMLTFSRATVDFIRRWILLHISMRINISLVSDFFIKLLKLPMSFFDTKLMGDLMQRMNDHSRVERFLTTQVLNIMFSLFGFIIFGCVLLAYSGTIFSVFCIGSILYGLWIAIFLKKREQLDFLYFEKQAINNSKTYQFITTMQEIKLQDCEQRRRWEWEDVQADLFSVNMKSLKLQQTQEAGSVFINEVKNIIITVLAATAVINGEMTLGMMLAVQYIIGQLNAPVEQLMAFLYSIQDVQISLERINNIHELRNEEENSQNLSCFGNEDKSIYLKNVDFKYDIHRQENILKNININIPKGKITAIVGTSGSGKTTIIKMLLGYYPPLDGNILIGNSNLNEISLKWWRRKCGVVMQDGVIFSETIARNIAVDDKDIDKSRLLHAAQISNIADFIENLPLKYDTLVGQDGIGLSQGQKQRILIARAVYKNPEYIFLDEATNALDANNEKIIVENLNEFYKGRTVIVVAHRLSTVKNADQIIVINKGEIVEIGNHTSLIEKKGVYFNLVKNQLELGN